MPVVTEAWIYDTEELKRIENYRDKIFAFMQEHGIDFLRPVPSGERSLVQEALPIVLVLDPRLSGRMGYYFVSHPTQSLFWLDNFDFSLMLQMVRVAHTDSTIGLRMREEYWGHNELFPHLYQLDDDDIQEADNMIEYSIGGRFSL